MHPHSITPVAKQFAAAAHRQASNPQMPYDSKSGQATAAFLNIKRRKGAAAARAFGKKHREDMSAAQKAKKGRHKRRRSTGYISRGERDA